MPRAILLITILFAASCSNEKKAGGPPYTPAEEQKSFRLPPGFRAELVASEPQVVDPVALAFDEAGRIYAVEMRDYPMGDGPPGRIKLLEDRDGDGYYESGSVFVDNLKLPNGVMRWRKGILVTAAPDILYFEDADGDGRADTRKVVLTGFATQNPQLRLNGPQYGYDNWVYAAYTRLTNSRRYAKEFGDKGHAIRFPDREDLAPLDINSRDVRFRPDEYKVEALAGFSQFGWGFNEVGDRFVVWNSDHVRHIPIDPSTLARNPNLTIPVPWETVSDHKAQSTVYPVTENPQHIHDSQVGQFTSSCGLSVYTGANLPPDFQNNSFTCEPVHNLVHRDILKPKGGTYVASRAYEKSEFLASTDSWFRPVFTVTGPDGALYIADYYRHSVEHPEFVPPEMLKDLDFQSKHQKGRIWRIVHESSRKRARPSLDRASDTQLVAALADPNHWYRINAQRLLVDRKTKGAIPALETMAKSGSALARIHAMWTLEGLGALQPGAIADSLSAPDPGVRRHGIRLTAPRLLNWGLRNRVLEMANDPDPQVRYEAALLIAGMPEEEAFPALVDIAKQDQADPWFQTVALSNARYRPMRWIRAVSGFAKPDPGFMHRAAALIGNRGDDTEVAVVLGVAPAPGTTGYRKQMMEGLAEGVAASSAVGLPHPKSRAGLIWLLMQPRNPISEPALRIAYSLRLQGEGVKSLAEWAEAKAATESAPLEDRAFAVGIAGLARPVDRFLAPQQPAEVRMAAAAALARSSPEAAAPAFLEHWRSLTGPMREIGMSALMMTPATIGMMLDAVEKNRIQAWAIGQARIRTLQQHKDEAIRTRAAKLFEDSGADRQKVLTAYMPSVHKSGDAAKGKDVFARACADCHELDGVGKQVGPDLRGIVKRYKESLLASILLPSEAIEPGYEEYVVETKDGRTLTGLLAKDTPSSITLRRAKGEEDVVPRGQIKELRSGGTSPMPDGIEKDVSVDQMADLIAYLKVPK